MRCYFMRGGHIIAVEILDQTDDAGRIVRSRELFETKGKPKGADGFEVWDGKRFVYRYPEIPQT